MAQKRAFPTSTFAIMDKIIQSDKNNTVTHYTVIYMYMHKIPKTNSYTKTILIIAWPSTA